MADDNIFRLKYNDTVPHLAQAAVRGDLRSVQRFLNMGRLPQAIDNRGWSAIHSCVAADQLEALKLMLNFRKGNKKYLTNLTTWEGESPLVIGLEAYTASLEVIALLLKSGANVNHVTNEGMTPLHYACKTNGYSKFVRLLLEYGAKIDVKEYINEYTPLHFAIVEAADLDMVNLLAETGDVNLADADGETPLYKASVCNFIDAVEVIIRKDKSSVNTIPRIRFSALAAASFNGNERLVRLLLNAGANAEISGCGGMHRFPLNDENTLPIHLSVCHPNIFMLLLQATNPETLLEVENVIPLSVYGLMYGPGTENFEAILTASLPEALNPIKIVDSDRVTDFMMGFPYACSEIVEKFHAIFKYCPHFDAEKVLKHVGKILDCYDNRKLSDKLQFLRLLADIGVSSASAFEAKTVVIRALKDVDQEREVVTELIETLSRPVLTLKQMSRDAARRFIVSRTKDSWAAYKTIRDFHFHDNLKQYLWCQVFR